MNLSMNMRPWLAALLVGALAACGGGSGGRETVLGFDSNAAPPTGTAVAPLNSATRVPFNSSVITAAFSEAISPITGTATFTVTCAAPCVSPAGTVALDSTNRIATFTSSAALSPATTYTGTVTGARSLATGLALAAPYVWQ